MHFHLGMKYNKDIQTFEWVNGDAFTYNHWAEFEPGGWFEGYFYFNLNLRS